jgi:hypothetical protein
MIRQARDVEVDAIGGQQARRSDHNVAAVSRQRRPGRSARSAG